MSRASRPDGHSCLAAGKKREGGIVEKDADREKMEKVEGRVRGCCVYVDASMCVCVCLAAELMILCYFLGHVPTQCGILLIRHPVPNPSKSLRHRQQKNT